MKTVLIECFLESDDVWDNRVAHSGKNNDFSRSGNLVRNQGEILEVVKVSEKSGNVFYVAKKNPVKSIRGSKMKRKNNIDQ